jgi:hypothetical protein
MLGSHNFYRIIITNTSIHQFEFHLRWENPFKLLTRHTRSSSFSGWSSESAPDLSLSTKFTVTQTHPQDLHNYKPNISTKIVVQLHG